MPKKFSSIEDRRLYARQMYANSKGSYKETSLIKKKERLSKTRQYIWDFLKEHPCVDCGETDPVVLEFDHLKDKKYSIGGVSSVNPSLESLEEEIKKCEVRCANCHRRKTAKDFGWYKDVIK